MSRVIIPKADDISPAVPPVPPAAFCAVDDPRVIPTPPHAAAAILASRHGEQLESALSTRDRIGQAKGIIMERFGVDDVQAFDMLRRLSQDGNTRLVDVAQRVIDTRSGN